VLSILIFAVGTSSGGRWRRSALLAGTLIGTGAAGAVTLAVLYGQADILQQAGGRFASIGSTELAIETYSNVVRLIEYEAVAEHILKSPWLGHGLGFTFVVINPQLGTPTPQWWVHQNYLLVWLKQGVIGLALFIWMLWTAFWLGARHARRREDPFESGWLAATAASTAFMAVFSMADFPFDSAESMFFLALLWGGSMAMAGRGFLRLRWTPHRHGLEPGLRPEPAGAP
jgi:O-antigen ligase